MCGVVASFVKQGYEIDKELFMKLLLESNIRGQHSSGLAWLSKIAQKAYEVHVQCNAKALISYVSNTPKIIIGHTRYSTSGKTPQPVSLSKGDSNNTLLKSLVLNGVITQASSEKWSRKFNVICKTDCDAEILLHYKQHPLMIEPSSQAVAMIDFEMETLYFWRNEERPLYYIDREDALYVASTKDIFRRIGFVETPIKCEPCVEYKINDSLFQTSLIRKPRQDLQV